MPLDPSELRWLEAELQAIRELVAAEARLRDAYRVQNVTAIDRLSGEFSQRARNLEETLSRRIDALHTEIDAKLDPIIDPQTGVYSLLTSGSAGLQRWAIAILTAIVLTGVAVVARSFGL